MTDIWFKRKQYGWGWYPATWQGWLVMVIYIALVVACGYTIDQTSTEREIIWTFALPIVLLTITLLRICYKKGEKPRWQWGKDDSNQNNDKKVV